MYVSCRPACGVEQKEQGMNWDEAISKHVQALERRIEALEKHMPLCADKQAMEWCHQREVERIEVLEGAPQVKCKLWADCTALLTRTAALERLTCDKGNENANAIASATARVAANEARIHALEERLETVWIAPINALQERCDVLENSVASLKLCTPPPEVESVRCDCNQTAFVGHKDDPVVTLWQLYKVSSDARTKIVLKLEDIEAKVDKLVEIKNEKEE